jgi:hypothetical protein
MDGEIVAQAQKLFKKDKAYWEAKIYPSARDDLHFLSDAEDAQWKQEDLDYLKTKKKTALTIDQLGQFINQVANDIRMNTPSITIIPDGEGSDTDTAEIVQGRIRAIEYESCADNAYDLAALNAIQCSIGFIRVEHEYESNSGFNQKLLIKRVVNPLAIYLDSESIEVDGRDARHGFVLDSMTIGAFKRKYKNAEPKSFGDETARGEEKEDEMITIAEFFKLDETQKEIGALESGEIEDAQDGVDYKAKRTIGERVVRRYVMSGKEVLEESVFPGEYIPIIPVYGKEHWIDGAREIHSLIRKSKDAQRQFNVWKSAETETLMNYTSANYITAEGTIDEWIDDWNGDTNSKVLRYSQRDLNGLQAPPPQVVPPPPIPVGFINAALQCVDGIKATMGIYNAALGQKSNETSGVAINQRKIEGDVATFHFSDNLVKSITQVGRVLLSALQVIYDTPRVIRIMGQEDKPKEVGINGQMTEGQERSFDLTQGTYGVRVITGASFTTKRQEAADFFTQLATRSPDLMSVMGDLMFENMDFAGAPAMAARMKKVVDPKFLEEEGNTQAAQVQQLSQSLEQAQQVIAQLQEQLQAKQENEQGKMQLEMAKLQSQIQSDQEERQIKKDEMMINAQIKERELAIKEQEILLKAEELKANHEAQMVQAAQFQQQGAPPEQDEEYSQ